MQHAVLVALADHGITRTDRLHLLFHLTTVGVIVAIEINGRCLGFEDQFLDLEVRATRPQDEPTAQLTEVPGE